MKLASLVALLVVAQVFGTATTIALPALAPKIAADFGVNPSLIGYQISVLTAAMLISLVFGGNLARRWGPCRVIQLALLLVGLGSALATIPLLSVVAFGSAVIGLGYGVITPCSSHLLARFTSPGNRNLVFSIKQAGVPGGALLAAAVLPSIAVATSWRTSLLLVGATTFLLALGLQLRRDQLDDDRDPCAKLVDRPIGGVAAIWKHRALRPFSIAGGCFSAVQNCLSAFTVVLFVEEIGFDLVAAGLVLAASQVGGIAGRVFWGWLADRLRDCNLALTLLTLVMTFACALVIPVSATWPVILIYALFFVLGSTSSGWNGAFLAEVASLSPRHTVSATTGASLLFVNAGTIVGASAFTNVYTLTGAYSWAFGFLALPSAAGLACLISARRATQPLPARAGASGPG
jgi:predicted MFS family arabinose efflux permease